MNKLQIVITLEWLIGLLFAITIMFFWNVLLSNALLLIIFIMLSLVFMFIFKIQKQGFDYPIEANIIARLLNQYPLIKNFIIIYFAIKMLFLIIVIANGGFQSGGTLWLMLITPYFLPFMIAIYYEQMQLASDIEK